MVKNLKKEEKIKKIQEYLENQENQEKIKDHLNPYLFYIFLLIHHMDNLILIYFH